MNADIVEPAAVSVADTDTLLQLEQRLIDAGEPFAVVTVIRAAPPTSTRVGAQALVEGDGTLHGWIGGGCSRPIVIDAARDAIRSGQPKRVRISNEPGAPDAEVESHAMPCASNGALELFIQPTVPAPLVVVFGATPAAHEACVLARRVGLRASIAADSPRGARFDADALSRMTPALMLVATQGDGDEDALEAALRSTASAVLLIASQRKAERLRDAMRLRGIGETRLAALRAPAGPPIHAHTPQEIALGAVAGLVALRHELEQASAAPAVSGADLATVTTEPVPPLPPCETIDARPARTVGRYVNPVCGMSVEIATAKHVVEYRGERVYFCCDCCKTEFERAPERYLAIAAQGAKGEGR
ncbi:xanthine dehydrogenase accessory factor [Paraburkholderia caballeronis]|uniref:XdhC family protein n=1 Tax=Paraburkholderia caballeronis TaxID=416943 RepID=UPI0010670A67|nr:XdhC family protein [Paraburkholderia caballeronis]TDV36485.1 xanthine dehydrogenase accessory factor [Paraburkholderia caballeronis]